jgi:hypothetical protein
MINPVADQLPINLHIHRQGLQGLRTPLTLLLAEGLEVTVKGFGKGCKDLDGAEVEKK